MKKAVIFDMDGVLIDSQPLHFKADQITLSKCNIEIPYALTEKYAGMSNPDRWLKYKEDFQLNEHVEELIARHVQTIDTLFFNSDLRAIQGIPILLDRLIQKNIKIAVASSSSYVFITKMLRKINIHNHFQLIVSGEDVKKSKPFPDVFLKTATLLDVSPMDCVVVEDSTNGVLAAKNAHMYCVGYQNKTSGAQDLSKADKIIDQFQTLIDDNVWLQ